MLRGTWLTLVPRVDGVIFNPRSHEIVWYEDIQEVPFRFRATGDLAGTSVVGAVDVYADAGLLIAQLPVSLRVRGPSDTRAEDEDAATWTYGGTHMFEAVFAFHAILGTGIGRDSLRARGAGDPSACERAVPLNEALWMELQYVRRYAPWLGTPDETNALQAALGNTLVGPAPQMALPRRRARRAAF
jgi:hypothetical protein